MGRVVLWQNVCEGMSTKEVMDVCPAAVVWDGGDSTYKDGSTTLAYIPSYRVADTDLRVQFAFLDGALVTVIFNNPKKATTIFEYLSLCRNLETALTAKYGEPVQREVHTAEDPKVDIKWEHIDIVVSLFMAHLGVINTTMFSLRYESVASARKRDSVNAAAERSKIAKDADLL